MEIELSEQTEPMRTHMCGELRSSDAGAQVAVCGWVGRRREHGEHLAFVDLRDHSGIVQCVVDGAADVRSEYVLRITGTVRVRPERSEEHTSELQSLMRISYAVFCLKKKKKLNDDPHYHNDNSEMYLTLIEPHVE